MLLNSLNSPLKHKPNVHVDVRQLLYPMKMSYFFPKAKYHACFYNLVDYPFLNYSAAWFV